MESFYSLKISNTSDITTPQLDELMEDTVDGGWITLEELIEEGAIFEWDSLDNDMALISKRYVNVLFEITVFEGQVPNLKIYRTYWRNGKQHSARASISFPVFDLNAHLPVVKVDPSRVAAEQVLHDLKRQLEEKMEEVDKQLANIQLDKDGLW